MKKILIVDDNQAAADGLVKLLKAMGWEAQALYSGAELIEYLHDTEASIAFIDIGMPDMDGYATVVAMRAFGHTLPAVALTGYGQQEDKEKAIAAGFTAHLTKPIGAAELRLILGELVSKN
ncbi:MAG: hybrid sensor histidine kinase/response regulator [Parcubacteria group bacterium]|nr:hybrid sensor histidine kinase/response regulator [Parcubacteria group bacterium]